MIFFCHSDAVKASSQRRNLLPCRVHPNTEISKFINAYKSASSRLLKKEFPQIRQKLWKEHFWSQSFCLITTGGAPIEVIKKYIESQGQRERKRKWKSGEQSI